MEITNELKNGDIIVNIVYKNDGKVIIGEVLDSKNDDKYLTVKFKTFTGETLKQFFRIATENEIKIYKLREMFKIKKRIKI